MTHPKTGERYPLRDYDTIYTNELIVASLTFEKTHDVPVKIKSFKEVMEGNETRQVLVDERTYTVTVKNKAFTEQTLQLPTHGDKVTMEVWFEDMKLFTVYHWTHPLMIRMPRRFTFGSYMSDVLGYIVATAAVIFIMLGAAKWTVQRSKVVPRGNYWLGLALLGYVMFFIYMIIDTLIYMFGVTNALWSLAPIALVAYIAGLFMVSIPLKTLICMRTVKPEESDEPRKDFEILEYVEREGKMYLPIGVFDFLMGRPPVELRLSGHQWLWRTNNADVQAVSYSSIRHERDAVIVEVAPIHVKEVEEWESGIIETESLAEALRETKQDFYKLKASEKRKSIEEGAAMAELFIEQISEGIGLKKPEEKKEEKKEADKSEQAGESTG